MKIAAAVLSVALGLVPAPAPAQEKAADPPPAPQLADVPRGLAEMLAIALRSNPEILQAEAKVRRAQADLNQTRLKVMEHVVAAFHEREKQEAVVRGTEQTFANKREMVKVGTLNQSELVAAEQAYAEARSKFMQDEARARYLLGLGGLGGDAGGMGVMAPAAPAAERPQRERPPIPEKYQKALEKKPSSPADLTSADSLAAFLQEEFQTKVINRIGIRWNSDLRLEDASIRQILTAVNDIHGACLVFRDYGILLIDRESAATMNAPTFPEDVPLREGRPR